MSLITATLAALAAATVVSPRRLYLAEDGETVVEEGDARSAFLAVGAGCLTGDPRVLRHLGAAVPEGAAPSPADAPSVKPVETEQSPTRNQIELEANSPTAASAPEVAAIEAKEAAGTATGPVEEAKADMPSENRATPPVDAAMNTPRTEGGGATGSAPGNKALAGAPKDKSVAGPAATKGAEGPKEARTNLKGLPAGLVLALDGAGLDSAEKVRAATDEEILALDGVGEKGLERIRAAYPKEG